MHFPEKLYRQLQKRRQDGSLRELKTVSGLTDFSSNDYLGLARSERLRERTEAIIKERQPSPNGSGGSRLLAGNTAFAEELEQYLAAFHNAPAALLFNSGYDANTGLLSAIGQRGDTILYDELAHASIKDGARLSLAQHFSFRHNDMEHLRQKLEKAGGNKYIIVESIYSMDGDRAPLEELAAIPDEFENTYLIIDEAHANGLYGLKGNGLASAEDIANKVFARIYTFGKALGCHGATVAGSNELKQYLLNFSRPFIYTTALPFQSLAAIRATYELLPGMDEERQRLKTLISCFEERMSQIAGISLLVSNSPIQGILIPGNENIRAAANACQEAGMDVRPIMSPTVKAGSERLRISLHSYNTEDEISRLAETIKKHLQS